MSKPETIKQCRSCPWRVDCVPERDIPNYDCDLARGLKRTIKSGLESISDVMHIMACHYSKPGEEFPCAGWLKHQLGPGNNIGVRICVMYGQLPVPEVDGDQHECYEDTLCSAEQAASDEDAEAEQHSRDGDRASDSC